MTYKEFELKRREERDFEDDLQQLNEDLTKMQNENCKLKKFPKLGKRSLKGIKNFYHALIIKLMKFIFWVIVVLAILVLSVLYNNY